MVYVLLIPPLLTTYTTPIVVLCFLYHSYCGYMLLILTTPTVVICSLYHPYCGLYFLHHPYCGLYASYTTPTVVYMLLIPPLLWFICSRNALIQILPLHDRRVACLSPLSYWGNVPCPAEPMPRLCTTRRRSFTEAPPAEIWRLSSPSTTNYSSLTLPLACWSSPNNKSKEIL